MPSQLRFLLDEELSERLEAILAATYCAHHQTSVIDGHCWHCDEDAFQARQYTGWVKRAKERMLPAKVLGR